MASNQPKAPKKCLTDNTSTSSRSSSKCLTKQKLTFTKSQTQSVELHIVEIYILAVVRDYTLEGYLLGEIPPPQ
ncbi:hypothetical protein CsatA_016696 [Cannabis sativa]